MLPVTVIVFPVIIDLINGYFVATGKAGLLSLGVVFRGLIILVGLYFLLMQRTALRVLLVLFLVMFVCENIFWGLYCDVSDPIYEINRAFKLLFPWFIVAILLYLHRKYRLEQQFIFKLVVVTGFLTAACLVFSLILGIGFHTYGDFSYGVKSFFEAQNDTGLTLLISLVVAVYVFLESPKILNFLSIVVIVSGCLLVGTRAGLIGPVLIFFSFGVAAILNKKIVVPKNKGYVFTVIMLIGIASLLFSGLYFLFTHMEHIDFIIGKLEMLTQETPRYKLEAAGSARIMERELLKNIFGEGGISFAKHVGFIVNKSNTTDFGKSGHIVENDVYDVFGYYGIVLSLYIYFWLTLLFLLCLAKAIFHYSRLHVTLLIFFLIFLGHSSVAGHGLFSAQVGNVMGPLYFLLLLNCTRMAQGRDFQPA